MRPEKGNILIIVALGIIAVSFIALGYVKFRNIPLVPTISTQSTTTSSPSPTPKLTPTPSKSAIKTLSYFLPVGWKTLQDETGILEIGYNPKTQQPNTDKPSGGTNKLIVSLNVNPCEKVCHYTTASLRTYDGGSQHQFIYKVLGITDPSLDRTKDYFEREYSYKNWSCLILYGLGYSARGTTWGMCAISPSQALFIEGPEGAESTEQIIQTIRLLK